jgi:hypothetical protein
MAPTQDEGAAQVGDNINDIAITAFPALAPRIPSVAYPDNFKLNIQKYDGRSDPNIWLSTYYVTVKEVGGNFDHMAAYFPLVLGDAPSLWLNKLPTGSIKSWADLSQAFTSNFQATYNRLGNAFNLGRVTMKTGERFATTPTGSSRIATPASVSATTRSLTTTRKASRIARSSRRSTSRVPP